MAVLECVITSFSQTEDIIENGIVNDVSTTEVQKILNLKHALLFIFQIPSSHLDIVPH